MTGSVMERSHAKLTQWAMGFWLAASSKKGFSAHQLHRALGCQYNTAWFMHHRIMEAMRQGGLDLPPMGGAGQIVEADETYFGNTEVAARARRNIPIAPSTQAAVSAASERLLPSLNAMARSARSMSRAPTRRQWPRS